MSNTIARSYQHTVIYRCDTKETMIELVRWLTISGAWFAAEPATLTIETSKIRPPRDGRLGPPMTGVKLIEPRCD